ncbi:arabinofuranosidase catalytic domain-containing protein, partial [Streptomyces sp. SAS_267]|uniref:arabinofuranosidase catalytic domain-containing protein n=1 Tax=Streptomyces sp. SAS_267 TaxID=3412750 RepID=UPI00403C5F94
MSSLPRLQRLRNTALAVLSVMAAVVAFAVGAPQATAAGSLPCDIYATAGTPCVAAHSLVRALYSSYNGSLYQVQRASDSATANIGLLAAGGYANAAAQDSFCNGTTCIITKIYDQSSRHNDLTIEGAGGAGAADVGAPADALPVTTGG